jgi:hypothetical protein
MVDSWCYAMHILAYASVICCECLWLWVALANWQQQSVQLDSCTIHIKT